MGSVENYYVATMGAADGWGPEARWVARLVVAYTVLGGATWSYMRLVVAAWYYGRDRSGQKVAPCKIDSKSWKKSCRVHLASPKTVDVLAGAGVVV